MKVLVIPDVHLKPAIFLRADEWMQSGVAERVVCLMDIADDWGLQDFDAAYQQAYDTAISFAEKYQNTLWCYGNHDVSYLWEQERHSGYTPGRKKTVCKKLRRLCEVLSDEGQLAFVHRIDNIIFSHGGLTDAFVKENVPESLYDDPDKVIQIINSLGCEEMWQDHSPIWHRPQYRTDTMYMEQGFLQVVGHTPVPQIEQCMNTLFCDVFSVSLNGQPSGLQEYAVVDTITKEYSTVEGRIDNNRGAFFQLSKQETVNDL